MISAPFLILSTSLFLSIKDVSSIYAGTIAYEGQFKYAVSIWQFEVFKCGGGIIDPTHILTAAHCIHDSSEEVLGVSAGSNAIDGPSLYLRTVSKRFIHPDFDIILNPIDPGFDTVFHDIGILRLTHPLTWSPTIQPVRLPNTSYVCYCCVCDVSGWGHHLPGIEEISLLLKWTPAIMLNVEDCRGTTLTENEACAHDPRGISMVGKGDSGGLLVCHGTAIAVVVAGTIRPPVRMVVILISKYLQFISHAVEGNMDSSSGSDDSEYEM